MTACQDAACLAHIAELTDMANGPLPILLHSFGHRGAVLLHTLEHYVSQIATLEEPEHQNTMTHDDPSSNKYGSFGTISFSSEGYSDEEEYE
eukprot:scaffold66076_cov31-Attheya_sp.AAC.3